ncbi:hypothetical protein AAOE16_01255 [Ekhidna sp. MALMAid0563]|uniref:hypothetical protein n=1 Tax=Ekhidna sp. MALMAid0563 TaxID=3143937 RepID=UPI0032E00385
MVRTATYEGKYTHLWQKYKPVLLKLMVEAQNEPQTYQFQQHEFSDLNNQKRTGYTFKMEIFKNQKQNKLSSSVATDLLSILQSSEKSDELTQETKYQFQLDKKFVLEVSRVED